MTKDFEAVIPLSKVGLSPSNGSVIPLKDGRLFWAWGIGSANEPLQPMHGNISSDGGRTWSEPDALKLTTGEPLLSIFKANLFRMSSGALGLIHTGEIIHRGISWPAQHHGIFFHKSEDEGRTWSTPVPINPPNMSTWVSGDKCFVLSDGRIIAPVYAFMGPEPATADFKAVQRLGQRFTYSERCCLAHSYAYYSDDQGQTWTRSRNDVFVLLEGGAKGSYSLNEPDVVELTDGRLLMMGRTNLGRLYRSYSEDRGATWLQPEPTELALIPSPCNIKRIPKTGDLLIIWNQASRWEMMIGLYRHRLSCAISKDEGETWQNHKNLESLDDVAQIEPESEEMAIMGPTSQPLDRLRYHRAPGPLRCNEPTCTFVDDTAVITYGHLELGDKSVIEKTYEMGYDSVAKKLGFTERSEACRRWPWYPSSPGRWDGNNKVRILPIDWFYS